MTINSYFHASSIGYEAEQNLYESIFIESIQISGQNYFYIPRTLNKIDQIFGEDVLSSFDAYVEIEMYLMDFTGYAGESEMMSKFGMEIRDTASFTISRKRYTETVVPILPANRDDSLKWRPNEGDLIYSKFSKSLFVIKFVEDESTFYQLKYKPGWILRCELVILNNEKFDTGNADIDQVFGTNLNRLDNVMLTESGSDIVLEDGGTLIVEEYVESKQPDDMSGYGDNSKFKQEFLNIMQFDPNDPFRSL